MAFTETERLIGDAAKNQVARREMVFDAKRLIGRKFGDPIVQADIKLWPFKVASGSGDKDPIVQADIKLWPFKVVSGSGDKHMIVVNAQGE